MTLPTPSQSDVVSRCFGCKNLYSLSQLVAREGVLVCRRHCARRHQIFEVAGTTIEVLG